MKNKYTEFNELLQDFFGKIKESGDVHIFVNDRSMEWFNTGLVDRYTSSDLVTKGKISFNLSESQNNHGSDLFRKRPRYISVRLPEHNGIIYLKHIDDYDASFSGDSNTKIVLVTKENNSLKLKLICETCVISNSKK